MTYDVEALLPRLSSFRPSDRSELARWFADGSRRATALSAVKEFVEVWDRAKWLEAYSIERIGKWIAKTQPKIVVEDLEEWGSRYPTEARQALIEGLRLGAQLREKETA
ncbi:hypothetical protein [Shinella sp.]|uniref:hypothetical protein n=1 Tax=Shinella sp. TaxID=1870904 RepID=UPI003F72760C